MAIESDELSELPSGATTATRNRSGTSVIRRCRSTMSVRGSRTQPILIMAFKLPTNSHTQIWVGEMPRIYLAHVQPSHGPAAFHPCTTRQDDKIQEPATLIYDACPRPGSQSTTTNHTETKPLSHLSGSWKGPGYYCRVFCRPQEHYVRGSGESLHPETEVPGEHNK